MPNNYGSLLQSIATQHIIETLGHQCEIINYVRKDERGLQGILSSMVSKKEWNENSLKKFAYIILRYPGEWMAQRAFDRMRKLHLWLYLESQNNQKQPEISKRKSLYIRIF